MCRRELRQGDPLSLLIFILVADGLSALSIQAVKTGLVSALNASKKNSIAILRHIDDALFFGWNDIDQAIVTSRVLHSFKLWSGLKVGFPKNQLIFKDSDVTNIIIERIFGFPRRASLSNI